MTELVGKKASVGITCVDPTNGAEVDSFSVSGTIEQSNDRWIALRREDIGTLFGLPPSPEALVPSDDGDVLLAALTVQVADADSVLELRSLGFQPE